MDWDKYYRGNVRFYVIFEKQLKIIEYRYWRKDQYYPLVESHFHIQKLVGAEPQVFQRVINGEPYGHPGASVRVREGDIHVLCYEISSIFQEKEGRVIVKHLTKPDIELLLQDFSFDDVLQMVPLHVLEREGFYPPDEKKPIIREPKWDKLPLEDSTKRQGVLGLIFNQYLERTDKKLFFNYDEQAATHIMVVGTTGNGKSVTAYDIAEGALEHNIPVLVLDLDVRAMWTGFLEPCDDEGMLGKYNEFGMKEPKSYKGKIYTPSSDVGAPLQTNLLARPETNEEGRLLAHAGELAGIIKGYCDLSKDEALEVRKIIFGSWKAGTDIDHNFLISQKYKKKTTNERLFTLNTASFLFQGDALRIPDICKPGEISVVSFTEIKDTKVKMFTAYYILRELVNYFSSQPSSKELKLLLVVEEAHNVGKDTPKEILNLIVRTLRKQGVGALLISQVLVDLGDVRANVMTNIYMRTGYDPDIDRAKIDLGADFASLLTSLETGKGIVSYPNFQVPVMTQFRPCYHRNRELTEDEIREKMHSD